MPCGTKGQQHFTPTYNSFLTEQDIFSTSNALDILVVKDKENIKPTITRGLGMMKSSLLSTKLGLKSLIPVV